MTNPYFDLPPPAASTRLAHAHVAWLAELQQWQLAAWRRAALTTIGLMSLSWAMPPLPQPLTVAERMAALSLIVVTGGRA